MAALVPLGPLAEFPEGSLHMVEVGGNEVAIAVVEWEVYAFGNECTRVFAPLSDGLLVGKTVECPLHDSAFDITTGALLGGPGFGPVPTYEVVVADGQVSLNPEPLTEAS